MSLSSFFNKFFKSNRNNNYKIIKYDLNRELALQDKLNKKLIEIDQEISETSKSLLEGQIVKLRSNLSKSNNFIDRLGQNIYKTKLDESIIWHQKKIKELYLTRKDLKINLEKIKGIYWINRIKRFLAIIFIGIVILLSLFLFISGFIIIIYLMPLIILICLGYLLISKKD
tara:strand:- start:1213 stop:1725 length:513 start_codon:yes stop_codon:yes gene_type:complete